MYTQTDTTRNTNTKMDNQKWTIRNITQHNKKSQTRNRQPEIDKGNHKYKIIDSHSEYQPWREVLNVNKNIPNANILIESFEPQAALT